MARRVRRVLRVLLGLAVVLVLVGLVANVVLVRRLDRIEGAFDGLSARPPAAAGETVLMLGTRTGGAGPAVPWLSGEQSVEAVMLIEVPPDGLSAEVESLPASSGIRPAIATSSPGTGVGLVEEWSGRRVDHVLAIDWDTFVRLARDNDVDPAYTYGSGPAVQHDFLGRVLEGALHAELRKQPLHLMQALRTTAAGTAVDDGWSAVELDLMVLSLRNLRSSDITFSMAQPG